MWTEEPRRIYRRAGDGYPSDLRDAELGGAAGAADPRGVAGWATAQDRHAGGDERHLLFAAHWLPVALQHLGSCAAPDANKRTHEIADAAVREGLTPLEYMLAVLRDESVEPDRRDRMAAAAAPYIHPRLSSTQIGVTIK
jgi:hypothetical protein